METKIKFFGNDVILSCDGKCDEAWGINWHGEKEAKAPADPGTYEGGGDLANQQASRTITDGVQENVNGQICVMHNAYNKLIAGKTYE